MTLDVLVVDDEAPQLDELCFLLRRDKRIGRIEATVSSTEALRMLRERSVDALFLDVQMPGLSGLELAGVLGKTRNAPPVVFVTAHESHAVQAFELEAVDYVLKPVREDRLTQAISRIVQQLAGRHGAETDDQIAVELAGVTRFVSRSDIGYAEAQGDYARLHTDEGSHLLRTPLTTLEQDWGTAGFVRIHRSLLVNLAHVERMRIDDGKCIVTVLGRELLVSRRHTRELRELLGRRGRPGR